MATGFGGVSAALEGGCLLSSADGGRRLAGCWLRTISHPSERCVHRRLCRRLSRTRGCVGLYTVRLGEGTSPAAPEVRGLSQRSVVVCERPSAPRVLSTAILLDGRSSSIAQASNAFLPSRPEAHSQTRWAPHFSASVNLVLTLSFLASSLLPTLHTLFHRQCSRPAPALSPPTPTFSTTTTKLHFIDIVCAFDLSASRSPSQAPDSPQQSFHPHIYHSTSPATRLTNASRIQSPKLVA